MTKQSINTGTGVNTGTGDTLRAAMSKINDNFDELYQLIGAGDSSTSTTLETANITTYVTDGQLTLDPRGDGTIVMNAPTIFNDIIRSDDRNRIEELLAEKIRWKLLPWYKRVWLALKGELVW